MPNDARLEALESRVRSLESDVHSLIDILLAEQHPDAGCRCLKCGAEMKMNAFKFHFVGCYYENIVDPKTPPARAFPAER